MYNYMCFRALLNDGEFNLKRIVEYYIAYISIFYGENVSIDKELDYKITDLQDYIEKKFGCE